MRGKQEHYNIYNIEYRITPADAGKTTLSMGSIKALWDHPRGCGENLNRGSLLSNKLGSPPRMRGKHPHNTQFIRIKGITPADAGKTSHCKFYFIKHKDHPRGCGENSAFMVEDELPVGSPPRMRGKQNRGDSAKVKIGITPADAGKTFYSAKGIC